METTQVFRTPFSRVIAWGAAVVAVVAPVAVGLAGGPPLSGLTAALPCAVVWALFFGPCVALTPAGIEVRNVLHTIALPWSAVSAARVRYSLEIVPVSGRVVTSWALSRGSRGRPSLADECSAVVTDELTKRASSPVPAAPVITWNRQALVVLAAGVALFAVGFIG